MRPDYLLYRDSCVQNRAIAVKYELKFTRLNNLKCFFGETQFSGEGLALKTSLFQQKLVTKYFKLLLLLFFVSFVVNFL